MEVITPPPWVRDAVFYHIFPDRFRNGDPANDPPGTAPWDAPPTPRSFSGGDLEGIHEKLPYLRELGVTALYLTPIFRASTNHRYDGEDYFQVDPTLGGDGAFRDLLAAAHGQGIRVVLDGVFNHCGKGHPFFQDAIERGRRSPYWGWFTIRGDRPQADPEPNYACWAGHAYLPEWNLDHPPVREYLLSVARHWIREGIDGWRLDTVEYLPPDFVRAVYQAVKEENPEAYVLGEVMGLATSWFRHRALDGVMHYKLREALVRFLAEESWDAPRFARALRGLWASYPPEANYACYTLLGSHDVPRFRTLCGGDRRKVALGAAFLFAYPGAPAIYYGDEVGLEGGEDPDCRRTFPWDEARWDRELLTTFRTLARLRREEAALRVGDVRWSFAEGRALVLLRRAGEEEVALALNAEEEEAAVPLPRGTRWTDLLGNERASSLLPLPGMSFRLLKRG
ncbi:MAG: glycoside hydrolase family 13 protein [Candidatus Bipolaricaulota bacterium]|nr:glycoside hydrolase family 13 protein [Candidatus Bipolaricaulota bacterium]